VTRIIAAVLVTVSAVCLYFALTKPIVISNLASINEIIRTVYTFEAFAEGKEAPTQEQYETSVRQFETLFNGAVLRSDAAKANYAELTTPKGYTAWDSARVLQEAGDLFSAVAIVAFSIVYPVVKTAFLAVMIVVGWRGRLALQLAEWTHKYTMLDVFVAAVTVVALSTQTLLRITTGPAVLWYAGYLVAGFAAVWAMIAWTRAAPRPVAAEPTPAL
jgi:hypothetical protein